MITPTLNFILIMLLLLGWLYTGKSQNNINDNHNLIALAINEKIEKHQKQIDHILNYLEIEVEEKSGMKSELNKIKCNGEQNEHTEPDNKNQTLAKYAILSDYIDNLN